MYEYLWKQEKENDKHTLQILYTLPSSLSSSSSVSSRKALFAFRGRGAVAAQLVGPFGDTRIGLGAQSARYVSIRYFLALSLISLDPLLKSKFLNLGSNMMHRHKSSS